MAPYPASAGAAIASARVIAAIPTKICAARRIVPILLVEFSGRGRASNIDIAYRLQSLPRRIHLPEVCFWQTSSARSLAASRLAPTLPPQAFPFSPVASAAQRRGGTGITTLQSAELHACKAASSARFWVSSFQAKPYFALFSSNATAPYPANAGAAESARTRSAEKPTTMIVARRIEIPLALMHPAIYHHGDPVGEGEDGIRGGARLRRPARPAGAWRGRRRCLPRRRGPACSG